MGANRGTVLRHVVGEGTWSSKRMKECVLTRAMFCTGGDILRSMTVSRHVLNATKTHESAAVSAGRAAGSSVRERHEEEPRKRMGTCSSSNARAWS